VDQDRSELDRLETLLQKAALMIAETDRVQFLEPLRHMWQQGQDDPEHEPFVSQLTV
jgi:hypothetical protein